MSKSNTTPLTDDEIDELSKFLDEYAVEKDGMSFEMLDGFLTAVISGPQTIAIEQWLPRVWRGEEEPEEPAADTAAVELATARIVKHYEHLAAVLAQGGADFAPWILEFEDDDGSIVSFGQEWALGYLRGIGLAEDAWEELLSDGEWQDDLDAVELLARGPDDEESGGEIREQTVRDEYIETMLGFALDAYDFWAEERLKPATQRRESPKVGRNDPCPCGSGKKYKQCHGANA
jgi:uncharacterized protein